MSGLLKKYENMLNEVKEQLNQNNTTIKPSAKDILDTKVEEDLSQAQLNNKIVGELHVQNLGFRNELFRFVKKITIAHMTAVAVILIASGVANLFTHTFLSENVLLAILGSTTAEVIGLMYVIAKYLFPAKG